MVQKGVDLRDHLHLSFPNLSDRQRFFYYETPGGATAQTDMNLNRCTIDQGHVFDKQAENAFPLPRLDGRSFHSRGKSVAKLSSCSRVWESINNRCFCVCFSYSSCAPAKDRSLLFHSA